MSVTVRNLAMNDDMFIRELDYQVSLSIAEGALRLGLLTDRETRKAKELLLEKYHPAIGILLADVG